METNNEEVVNVLTKENNSMCDLDGTLDKHNKKIVANNEDYKKYIESAIAYMYIQEYQTALLDVEDAIRINNDLVDAYIIKTKLLLELNNTIEAITFVKKLPNNIKDNKDIKDLLANVNDYNKISTMSLGVIEKFLLWLKDKGAIFDKIDIVHYTSDHRGIITRNRISKGEIFMYVPIQAIITLEIAKQSVVVMKTIKLKGSLLSPKHSYLATFILQEMSKEDSEWKPYLNILPRSTDNFPIFFTKAEKELLKGTFFLERVKMKREQMKRDYMFTIIAAPEFGRYSFKQFAYARALVSSRIFLIHVNDKPDSGLVPLADMQNHFQINMSSWTYNDNNRGFTVQANVNMKKGEEVYNSYGPKCNSRYFFSYGFTVENNKENEIPIQLSLDAKDELFSIKFMLNGRSNFMRMRVKDDFTKPGMLYLLCYIRLILFKGSVENLLENRVEINDTSSYTLYGNYIGVGISAVSVSNEISTHKKVIEIATNQLKHYSEVYEFDLQLLKTELKNNVRNCIRMRAGEKRILLNMIRFSELCLKLLELPLKEAKEYYNKIEDKEMYEYYINKVLFPLMQ